MHTPERFAVPLSVELIVVAFAWRFVIGVFTFFLACQKLFYVKTNSPRAWWVSPGDTWYAITEGHSKCHLGGKLNVKIDVCFRHRCPSVGSKCLLLEVISSRSFPELDRHLTRTQQIKINIICRVNCVSKVMNMSGGLFLSNRKQLSVYCVFSWKIL